MAECDFLDFACKAKNLAESAAGDAIENMANAVLEAFGKVIASAGTIWVHIGTPNLTGTGGRSGLTAGSSAPDSTGITTVLGYVTWIGLAVAVLSLFILGGLIATRMRAGEGIAAVGRVGLVLSAVVLISGSSSIVAGLMPSGPRNSAGAVLFIQSGLWWYMAAMAVASVIIGGIRMVWEQRAEPGRETVKSLLTLVVVAGSGVTVVGLLVAAADSFSVWIINGSLSCDVTTDSACFGKNMLELLALTTNPSTGSLGALLVIILGLIAILASGMQIVLMVARSGMLVILAGVLPFSASFTNTETGKAWFKKCISWLTAFILYKPAAAIVYAATFQLLGTDVFSDDGSGFITVVTGLMLMSLALLAMPALMRFVTPMVGALAGGSGGAAAGAAAGAIPSGASALGRLGSGRSSRGPDGADGPQGSPGPQGSSTAPSPQQGPSKSAPAPTTGAPSTAGAGGGGTAASTSAGAGGGAAASAGAAAGPVGIAAGAALAAGKKVGEAAQSAADQSTSEGGGPDGSR